MFYPISSFIALRYLRAKRKNRFASFISIISVLGVTIGVSVLIIVLSVMNGFEKEVIKHILGMESHATIIKPGGRLVQWHDIERRIAVDPRVQGTAPYIRASGMINHRGTVRGIVVRGIIPDEELRVSQLSDYVDTAKLGRLVPGSNRVLLGQALADELRAAVGDQVTFIAPRWDRQKGALLPKYQRLEVAGTFSVGMQEFDAGLSVMHLEDAAALFGFADAVSGIRLRVADAHQAPLIAQQIASQLPGAFASIDWTQYHRNFFQALTSQKRIMFAILSLIVAVAAFNVVATMVMIVNEKQSDIAILRTLGISTAQIMLIFVSQGVLIGLLGTACGVLLGAWGANETETVVAVVEQWFNWQFIKPDVYYIDYLPSELRMSDIRAVSGVAFALCVLATLYPAWRAARVHPVQALRYE